MKLFIRWVLLCSVLLTAAACSDSPDVTPSGSESGSEFGSALVTVPSEDRRIGIVHSETSKQNFYDPFAYNQLFAAMQHQATMAGIPFDLLTEVDLATADSLLQYDALLIPAFSHVADNNRNAIREALLQAQNAGISIVTSGEFMATDQNGQTYPDATGLSQQVLGVSIDRYLSAVAATVNVTNTGHPVTRNYTDGEELVAYDQIWFPAFVAGEGETTTVLTTVTAEDQPFAGAQIIDRAAPVIHFANEQIMADNNMLWSALRWAVYGDVAPIALQLSRNDSVFIARNDMDQAMIAASLFETEIPLLGMITDWKRDYNFVSSYYIDIGNDPAIGQYTDWGVSAPLYSAYIELGNEMGTHSWTHPHFTKDLNATELEFEFNQSKNEISAQLGVPVVGGAVPGTAESLEVVEELNQWFDYFSGRSGSIGSGYQNAIGFLEPQHDMLYFSLNTSPDFTLIDVLDNTPQQSTEIWRDEIDHLLDHSATPVIHWLWHDYGPTTQTAAGRYSKEMFADTLAHAYNSGTEFTTVANLHDRIRAFQSARLAVGTGETINVSLDSQGVGQLALEVQQGQTIQNVANWYAYDDKQVFIADAGGSYSIKLGSTQDEVTRISALPMRARLIDVTGNGNELDFTFEGQGDVVVTLSPAMVGNVSVSGAVSFNETQGELTLQFSDTGAHSVSLRAITPINNAPEVIPQILDVEAQQLTKILLSGSDPDGDTLQYQVTSGPQNGTLTGNPPKLQYIADTGFSGTDSIEFTATDGALTSAAGSISINVTVPPVANTAPVANSLVLETFDGQPLSFVLSGSDDENQALTFQLQTTPASGTLTGTAPNLVYSPAIGFTGVDKLQFTVNDGETDSAVESVTFNVNPQPIVDSAPSFNLIADSVIDGVLSEWAGLQSLGTDANDVTGENNSIDWNTAWIGHDASHYHIAYRLFTGGDLTWGHSLYIDTDTDTASGFHGFSAEFPIGADYVLQGDNLFRYTATAQDEWAWEHVQTVQSSVNGQDVEIALPLSLINNAANIDFFFHGNSTATGGTSIDLFPDNATNVQALLSQRKFSYSTTSPASSGNVAPVGYAQEITINSDTSVELLLTGTDINGDDLTYSLQGNPVNGVITGQPPLVTYLPNTGFAGTDTLSFTVSDGTLESSPADITINVVTENAVNRAPLANGQTLSTGAGQPLSITLSAVDPDSQPLSYRVITPTANGELTGSGQDFVYTPGTDFSGLDSFQFVANDGSLDSEVATVTISVATAPTDQTGDQISNQIDGITIDGIITDWAGVPSSGLDPDDVTGADNPLDWRELWIAHDDSTVYMAYRNDGPFELSWGHGIYIDTDNNINTGFRGFSAEYPLGADILIEAGEVHSYTDTGTGTDWSWVTDGSAQVVVNGDIGELSVARSLLGNPQSMQIYLRAINVPFGGIGIDHFPDAALSPNAPAADRTLVYSLSP